MTNGSRRNKVRSKSITDYFDAFGGAVVATLYYLKFFNWTKFRESFLIPQFGIMQGCTSGLDDFENLDRTQDKTLSCLKKFPSFLLHTWYQTRLWGPAFS